MSIDPLALQQSGIKPDSTGYGAMSIHPDSSPVVMVPFRDGQYSRTASGGAVVAHSKAITGETWNDSSTQISIVMPTNLAASVEIAFWFYGRVFGVQWNRNATNTADFTVTIDGRPYGVTAARLRPDTQAPWTVDDGMNSDIVTSDLAPGRHFCSMTFTVDPAQLVQRLWFIYGLLLERAAGYKEAPRASVLLPTTALTTSAVSITYGTTVSRYARALGKIYYMNTTAAPITVTVSYQGVDIWSKPIPANDTVEFTPSNAITIDYNQFRHRASATGVSATLEVQF